MRAKRLCAIPLLLSACSWTFNDQAPEIALLGEPPDPASLQRLNRAPANSQALMRGADGAYWVAIDETPTQTGINLGPRPPAARAVTRLWRLSQPAVEEQRSATQITVTPRSLVQVEAAADGTSPTQITLHRPGDAGADQQLSAPAGRVLLLTDSGDQVVLIWSLADKTQTYRVVRRDGSLTRELPVMAGVDPTRPQEKGRLAFDASGEVLFAQDAEGKVVAHRTTAEQDTDLGAVPRAFLVHPSRSALLVCDDKGVRLVPADGSARSVLDPAACEPALLRVGDDALIVTSPTGARTEDDVPVRTVRRVPLKGGAVQVLAQLPLQQILALGPGLEVIASRDPASLFGNGVGDGWLGELHFMDRGRGASFSADGTRLRWLEGGANSESVGELLSAPVDTGAPLHLALNVRQYSEIAPGRVLAIANAAYKGTQNRLILIDEPSRTARWVVDSARDFIRIPGSDEVLARVVSGSSYQIVRAPLPR